MGGSLNLPEKCDTPGCKHDCRPIRYRLATRQEQLQGERMKMVAKYKCNKCNTRWRSSNSSGSSKACPHCETQGITNMVKPYRYQSTTKIKPSNKKKIGRRGYRRWFGSFECDCGNEWKSAYAWEGMHQECRNCRTAVLPNTLDPLKYTGGVGKQPHQEDLCEMCQKLGHSCKDFTPVTTEDLTVIEDEDIEDKDNHADDESVVSLLSSTSTDSGVDQEDDENTPVATDDEEQVDTLLADNVANLAINDY